MRGIINILIGLAFIGGGLSGEMVLIGTESGGALALVGVVILFIGLARAFSSHNE
jgi:hypothetical protein